MEVFQSVSVELVSTLLIFCEPANKLIRSVGTLKVWYNLHTYAWPAWAQRAFTFTAMLLGSFPLIIRQLSAHYQLLFHSLHTLSEKSGCLSQRLCVVMLRFMHTCIYSLYKGELTRSAHTHCSLDLFIHQSLFLLTLCFTVSIRVSHTSAAHTETTFLSLQ